MVARKLAHFDGIDDDEIILAPTSVPAIFGDAESGIDWHCGNCDELLASSVEPWQLFNFLIKCYSCGEIGEVPRRSPGDPVGPSTVVLNPGTYRLTGSVTASSTAIVGESAARSYIAEVGRTNEGQILTITDSLMIGESSLRDLAAKAISLLGDNYDRLAASDRRGLSSPTPPLRRHRIVELIAYTQELAQLFSERAPGQAIEVDGPRLTELMAIVGQCDRWKNHPVFQELLTTLTSDNNVSHTVMLLCVASYLADARNGVGIVPGSDTGRIPDIRLLATGNVRAEVEIKAPDFLHGPLLRDPSAESLEKKITKLVKSSASAKHGQFDPGGSGVLAICGFHSSPSLMPRLVAAARKVLSQQKGRKRHLVAIAFFDLGFIEVALSGGNSMIIPTLKREIVLHPSYSGPISLDQNPPERSVSPGQLGPTV